MLHPQSARLSGITALVILTGFGTMQPGVAQEKESRWSVYAGAFFPDVDTEIQFRSQTLGIEGSVIDFEDDLGLRDRDTLPILGVRWKVAKRHTLDLLYFQLSRSGSQNLNTMISFPCDKIDPADCMPGVPNAPNTCGDTLCILDVMVDVSSRFDVGIARVGYAYAFYQRENTEWALSVGVHVDSMEVAISDGGVVLSGTVVDDVTVPLPSFGMEFRHRFRPKWTAGITAEWFGVEFEEFEGDLLSASAVIQWDTWDKFGLALAWNFFELDIEAGDTDFDGRFKWQYTGPMFALKYDF